MVAFLSLPYHFQCRASTFLNWGVDPYFVPLLDSVGSSKPKEGDTNMIRLTKRIGGRVGGSKVRQGLDFHFTFKRGFKF